MKFKRGAGYTGDSNEAEGVIALVGIAAVVIVLAMYLLIYLFAYGYLIFGGCSNDKSKEEFQMIRAGSGIEYKVHEDLTNPKLAADTMDRLNTVAHKLIDHMITKYVHGTGLDEIREEKRQEVIDLVQRLKKNFKTAALEENIPSRSGGDTSYVMNKGDTFAMCLRDPLNDNEVDDDIMNELRFVLFHEMSHLADVNFGHEKSFWNTFRFVLQEATLTGLYEPINYKRIHKPYCGIKISYSPLYDNELSDFRKKM